MAAARQPDATPGSRLAELVNRLWNRTPVVDDVTTLARRMAKRIDAKPGELSTRDLQLLTLGDPRYSNDDLFAAENALRDAGYYRLHPFSPSYYAKSVWWPPDKAKIAAAVKRCAPGAHRDLLLRVMLHPAPETLSEAC